VFITSIAKRNANKQKTTSKVKAIEKSKVNKSNKPKSSASTKERKGLKQKHPKKRKVCVCFPAFIKLLWILENSPQYFYTIE
jgi:hypothetical protein